MYILRIGILLTFGIPFALLADGIDSILEPVTPVYEPAPAAESEKEKSDAEVAETAEELPKVSISSGDIRRELIQILSRHYNLQGELRLRLTRHWRPLKATDGLWSLEVVEFPMNGLQSNILLRFAIMDGDAKVGEWPMAARVELWQEVLVANRRLVGGEVISPRDFDVRLADGLRLRDAPVEHTAPLNDYIFAKSIGYGQPLLWRDVEPKPMVRRGDIVEVSAAEGLMQINMKAQAMQDGVREEFISVRNLSTKKEFQAKIIDENLVRVYF